MPAPLAVLIETGPRRKVFAQAVGWPGWCRSGRTEEAALAALANHAERYRAALGELVMELPTDQPLFEVVERVAGDVTTDFGAPGKAGESDRRALAPGEPQRFAAFMAASWAALDAVLDTIPEAARGLKPSVGRSPLAMWLHTGAAERAYLSALLKGLRELGVAAALAIVPPRVSSQPTVPQVHQVRSAFQAALAALPINARFDGPFAGTSRPAPYWVRRGAWHVLDHAWQLQDGLTSP